MSFLKMWLLHQLHCMWCSAMEALVPGDATRESHLPPHRIYHCLLAHKSHAEDRHLGKLITQLTLSMPCLHFNPFTARAAQLKWGCSFIYLRKRLTNKDDAHSRIFRDTGDMFRSDTHPRHSMGLCVLISQPRTTVNISAKYMPQIFIFLRLITKNILREHS